MALKKADKAEGSWEQIRNAVLANGTIRSPLWHWMRQNHDRLNALFEQAAPAWPVLAETFGGMGLTDRTGQSPTAATARKTWYRVRQHMKRARTRRAQPMAGDTVSGTGGASRPGGSRLLRAPAASESLEPESPHQRFGVALPRGHRTSEASAAPVAPMPDRVRRTPEEVARIVADMMSGAPKNPFRRDKGD
jgi:hypothetical protein